MQPRTPCPKDNDIRLIIPFNALSARFACSRQHRRTNACGSSVLEEIAPAQSVLFLKLWFLPSRVVLPGHVSFLPEVCDR
jgi:hypothetical protein